MMKLSTQPILTPVEKSNLRRWLINTLGNEKLSNNTDFPVPDKVIIYMSGNAKIVKSGYWETYSDTLILARDNSEIDMVDRLAILCTLAQYCDDSVELREAMQKAIMRYLLGEYQTLSSTLVNSTVQPRGIAFSTTGGVASLFADGWMTPSGESVDVSGDDWVVCASELPSTTEPVVDTNFNATPFGPAFPPVEPIDEEHQLPVATREFQVGDRVRWTEIPGIGPHVGSGEVIEVGENLRVRDTRSLTWNFSDFESLLSHE